MPEALSLFPTSPTSSIGPLTGSYTHGIHPTTEEDLGTGRASSSSMDLDRLTISMDGRTDTASKATETCPSEGSREREDVLASVTQILVKVWVQFKANARGEATHNFGFLAISHDEQRVLTDIAPVIMVLPEPFGQLEIVHPADVCGIIFYDQETLDMYRTSLPPGIGGSKLFLRKAANGEDFIAWQSPVECGPRWLQILDQVGQLARTWLLPALKAAWERLKLEAYVYVAEWTWHLLWGQARVILGRQRPQLPGRENNAD